MTEEQPHSATDRITALEVTVAHMRERIGELVAHNRVQDMEAEKQADRLGKEIEKLTEQAWSFLKWLGGTLFAVLCSVILKTLGLV
jgi:uncharacterized coiled-coil protein SlyX